MTALLALLGFGKSIGSAVMAWLSRRSLAELACIILALSTIVITLDRNHWKHVATERQAQLNARIAADKALTEHALQVKRDTDALTAKISTHLRSETDAQNRAIAADAGGLLNTGPGKAVCLRLPGPASGHDAPAAKPDDAGPALPPADSAAVPWNWLVHRAEEHDQLLAEVEAWRQWHDQVVRAWPK